MNHFDSAAFARLSAKIAEVDANETQHLRSGVPDMVIYHDRCGYLRALANVQEWMTEIEQKLNKGE